MPNQQQQVNAGPIDKTKVNPNTQTVFDMFIINGMKVIYDDGFSKSTLARVSANEDPTQTIAEILVDIVMKLTSSAKGSGKKIPPEVVLHGGNFLLAELLKVLEAAGMQQLTEEQITAVWQIATSNYIDQALKSGDITQQELMALNQEIEQTDEGQKILAQSKGTGQTMPAEVNPVAPAAAPQTAPNALAAPQQGV